MAHNATNLDLQLGRTREKSACAMPYLLFVSNNLDIVVKSQVMG